jgi:hypothetical protein
MRDEHERSSRERCIHQQMLLGAVASSVAVDFIFNDIEFPGSAMFVSASLNLTSRRFLN